jgi:hypothetical protein
MDNYLGDKKTESILLKVIRGQILEVYQGFHETVIREYEKELWNKVETVVGMGVLMDQFMGRRGSIAGSIRSSVSEAPVKAE